MPVSDTKLLCEIHKSHFYERHKIISVGGFIHAIAHYGLKAEPPSDTFWTYNQHVCFILGILGEIIESEAFLKGMLSIIRVIVVIFHKYISPYAIRQFVRICVWNL